MDDDDEWINNKLELQVEKFINSNDKVGIVYTAFYEIDRLGNKKVFKNSNKEGKIFKDLLKLNMLGGCSIPLLLKQAVIEANCFDERFPSSQDYDLWLAICKNYEVAYVDKPLVNYYISSEAITRNIDKRLEGWKLIEEKYQEYYNQNLDCYNYFVNTIACQLIFNGYIKKGVQYYKKALQLKLFTINNLRIYKSIIQRIIKKLEIWRKK